ncbi:MAG: hypothetical protein K2X66_17470 [Cyanobacteria bacterium]|nr:hypothetical protein [Cyanobacteriota bacterium]
MSCLRHRAYTVGRFHYCMGSSLIEYALPAVFIALAVLLFLTSGGWFENMKNFVAGNENGSLSSQNGHTTLEIHAQGQVSQVPDTVIDQATIENPSPTSLDPSSPKLICFAAPSHESFSNTNKNCIRIDSPPTGNELIGSLGGGTLDASSKTLQTLKLKLQELGAPSDVLDKVSQLANQGHAMGEKLKQVEERCNANVLCNKADADEAKEILSEVSKHDLQGFQTIYQRLTTFLNANPTALEKFPEAKLIIDRKVQEIQQVIINIQVEDNYNISFNNGKGKNVKEYKDSRLSNLVLPVIHQDANQICQQGGANCTVAIEEKHSKSTKSKD